MKNLAALVLLALSLPLSSCKEDPAVHTNRLKFEAVRIQNSTLQAILENDLKFQIDLGEQDRLFASLRTDLQRCRVIEAELRKMSPGPEVVKLEENTAGLLLAIIKREEHHQSYRDAEPQEHKSVAPSTAIEALERTIKISKESGWDTEEVEQLLSQLKKQRAEQAGAGQAATRSGSDSESEDKPQPESEGLSR